MYYWIREIFGWLLVVISLYLAWMALSYIENRQVIEASVVVFLCGMLMRGGMQLVRVSTAARIFIADRSEHKSDVRPDGS